MLFTKKGQFYLPRQTSHTDANAAASHATERELQSPLSRQTNTSLSFFEQFGKCMWQYFLLTMFVIFLNFILTVCGLMLYLFDLSHPPSLVFSQTWTYFTIFYTSLYFLMGITFVLISPLLDRTEDISFEERENTSGSRKLLLSFVITFLFLIVTSGIICGFVWAQRSVMFSNISLSFLPFGLTGPILMGLLVSLSFSIFNLIWTKLSFLLTQKEGWKTWSSFKKSHAFKLITVKVILASLMYLFLSLILTFPANGQTVCIATSVGNAYLIVFATEILVSLFVKTIVPLLFAWWKGSRQSDFDVSEEMLEIFYRLFIFQLCSYVSPFTGVVALSASLLEFFIDVFRLKFVCVDPGVTLGDLRYFIGFMFVLIALLSFVSYPNGFLWMTIFPDLLPLSYRSCLNL